jgi:hypothetical protein
MNIVQTVKSGEGELNKERESSWDFGGPVGPTELMKSDYVFGECKCRLHRKSQRGVAAEHGCWKAPIGKHPAVKAAEEGRHRFCAASEGERVRDDQFERLCLNLEPGMRSFDMPEGLELGMGYATGTSDRLAFGRGYCEFRAIYTAAMMRVARVLGPNPLVLDVMKVLCLVGRCTMKPLKLVDVGDGFYHVVEDKSVKGMCRTAGKDFYNELVRVAKGNAFARIGVDFPADLWTLQFGDAQPIVVDLKVDILDVFLHQASLNGYVVVAEQLVGEELVLRELVRKATNALQMMLGRSIGFAEEVLASDASLSEEAGRVVVQPVDLGYVGFDWAEEVETEFGKEEEKGVDGLLPVNVNLDGNHEDKAVGVEAFSYEGIPKGPRVARCDVAVCGPNILRNRIWRAVKKERRKRGFWLEDFSGYGS